MDLRGRAGTVLKGSEVGTLSIATLLGVSESWRDTLQDGAYDCIFSV